MDKEEETFNLNINKNKDSNSKDKYGKYQVDDSNSEISEEDIETKMNRLILIKKKNKDKIKVEPLNLEDLKKDANKFKKKTKENKEKKEKEKKNKIKEGLKLFEKKYKNILEKLFFGKIKQKVNVKENIKKGFNHLESIGKKLKEKKRKNIFSELKNLNRKKE